MSNENNVSCLYGNVRLRANTNMFTRVFRATSHSLKGRSTASTVSLV